MPNLALLLHSMHACKVLHMHTSCLAIGLTDFLGAFRVGQQQLIDYLCLTRQLCGWAATPVYSRPFQPRRIMLASLVRARQLPSREAVCFMALQRGAKRCQL